MSASRGDGGEATPELAESMKAPPDDGVCRRGDVATCDINAFVADLSDKGVSTASAA